MQSLNDILQCQWSVGMYPTSELLTDVSLRLSDDISSATPPWPSMTPCAQLTSIQQPAAMPVIADSSQLTVYHPKVQRLAGVFAATSRTVPHGYSSAQPSISPVISREKQSCMHRKYMWNHKLTLYFILLWTRYIYIYMSECILLLLSNARGGHVPPWAAQKKSVRLRVPPSASPVPVSTYHKDIISILPHFPLNSAN